MGLSDRAEAVADVKETKEAKGEGLESTIVSAHSESALGDLVDKRTVDFLKQKTSIEQVKVDDKTVNLTDGKHEKERGAIKDAAQAMAKGDTEAVTKAFDGLTPEQAKTVAAGLDKALRPGAAVSYDGDSKTIDLYTNPAKLGDTRSTKLMVPTDGGTPRKGMAESGYDETGPAKSEDFKRIVGDAVKGDAARKDSFGLTMAAKFDATPALFKSDVAEASLDNPPPPPEIEVRSGHALSRDERSEITVTNEKHGNVSRTEVELPNGVKVEMTKDSTLHEAKEGRVQVGPLEERHIKLPEGMEVERRDDGTIIDKKTGHPVLREMEDGSTRVWTDKGVYNVYPDGEVTKETAIKNRDGTWTVLDTKTPLGDMRVPNLAGDKLSSAPAVPGLEEPYQNPDFARLTGDPNPDFGRINLEDMKFDAVDANAETAPLFRDVTVSAAPDTSDSTVFEPDKPTIKNDAPPITHKNPDGSGYMSRDGKIGWISSADGSIQKFPEYDDQGNLTKVSEARPGEKVIEWTKQKNGQWTDGYGHTRKDMAVAKDGTITYTDSDGAKVTANVDGTATHKYPDGRIGTQKKDGSYEEKDKAGNVLKTRDNDYEKHYDKAGHLTKSTQIVDHYDEEWRSGVNRLPRRVAEGDTTHYAKDGHKTKTAYRNGTSEEYDKQGRVTKLTDARKNSVELKYDAAGHPSMIKDGKSVAVELHNDGSYSYKHPKSGDQITHYRDGSEIHKNDKGQIEAVTDAKGHKYKDIKYDDQGHVTEITIDGTTWKDPKHTGNFEDGKGHSMTAKMKVDQKTGDILVQKTTVPKVSYEEPVTYVVVHQKDGTERQDYNRKF